MKNGVANTRQKKRKKNKNDFVEFNTKEKIKMLEKMRNY